jgi:type IV secretory pathway VirB3-like protein
MRKRGTPLPVNGALNRSRTKLGLELGTWMVIVFVSISVFLVGFRMLAIASFPILVMAAWLIVRKHPKMFQLWGHSLQQKSHYDPRKY